MSTTVLLVAPNASQERLVETAFLRAGYTFQTCDTFSSGRRVLHEQQIALAVVDDVLPDGSGMDLLMSATRTPVILLSEDLSVNARLAFLRSGAIDCVGKPYDALHLVSRAVSVVHEQKGTPPMASPGFARRLLVVDDSVTYATALAEELHKDGHDVALARAAHEALAYGAIQDLDLVIVDAFLPDMNGVDLCGRLRAMPALRRTPVVVLTGREKSAVRGRAMAADASDLLVKSRDLQTVRMHVRRMLSSDDRPAVSHRDGSPATQRPLATPASQRSATPGSQRSVAPGSQRSATPSSHHAVAPGSQRSATPSSHHTVAPGSQRSATPSSHHNVAPGSQRSATPGSHRSAVPSSQRSAPALHSSIPPPGSQRGTAPASHRTTPPPSRVDTPPSTRRSALPTAPGGARRREEPESPLLEQLATASGLSKLVARGAVERACQRAGVKPQSLSLADLDRVVPELEQVLRFFLPPEVVAGRMAEMARLARG